MNMNYFYCFLYARSRRGGELIACVHLMTQNDGKSVVCLGGDSDFDGGNYHLQPPTSYLV